MALAKNINSEKTCTLTAHCKRKYFGRLVRKSYFFYRAEIGAIEAKMENIFKYKKGEKDFAKMPYKNNFEHAYGLSTDNV